MFEIELTEQSLIVRMQGIYRFLALRQRVESALTHVRGVTVGITPELREIPFRATRKVGTRLLLRDHHLIIGSFGTLSGGEYFFAIRSGERAVTIALEHERYVALVLEVDDPEGTAPRIGAAAERARAAAGAAG